MKIRTLQQVKRWMNETVKDWLSEQNEDRVRASVKAELDRLIQDVALAAIGLDRAGNGLVPRFGNFYLRDAATKAAREWITKFTPPPLTAQHVQNLMRLFKQEYECALRAEVDTLARQKARDDVEKLRKEVLT